MSEEKKPLWREFCKGLSENFHNAKYCNVFGFNTAYAFKFEFQRDYVQLLNNLHDYIIGESDSEIFKIYFDFRDRYMIPNFNSFSEIPFTEQLRGKIIGTYNLHKMLKESFEEDRKPKLDPGILKPIEDKINTAQQWIAATQDKIAFIAEAIDRQTKLLEGIAKKLNPEDDLKTLD